MANSENQRTGGVRLMRKGEVAESLQVAVRTVHHLIQSGELPVVRIGRAVRLREQDVRAYCERSIERGAQPVVPRSDVRG